MSNPEKVLALLDRGILPTQEEQQKLGLTGRDLARRWMSGMQAEADKAKKEDQAAWRSFFERAYLGRTAADDWDRFIREGSDMSHVLFDVVEQYAETAWLAHLQAAVHRACGGDKQVMNGFTELFSTRIIQELFATKKPQFWYYPGYYLEDCKSPAVRHALHRFLPDGKRFTPDAGELIVMSTGCGGAEGVSIKHDSRDVLVTVTGVLGPWNFDPSDKTVEFEKGSKSVQVSLAYQRGVPCLARMLYDMVILDQILEARKSKSALGPGFRRDGAKTIPFHAHFP